VTTPRSRRSDILGAAEHEFITAGFAGARIERIAAAAGVNKQLLFHYFGSKEGLFGAALEGLLARAEPREGGATPPEALRSSIGQLQSGLASLPGLAGIVADANADPDFPAAARGFLRGWLERHRSQLARAVADGQARGFFRDDIDPDVVASLALGAVLGSGIIGTPHAPIAALIADHCAWH
jgi:TetR/AcrR family transcriptional regulator